MEPFETGVKLIMARYCPNGNNKDIEFLHGVLVGVAHAYFNNRIANEKALHEAYLKRTKKQ